MIKGAHAMMAKNVIGPKELRALPPPLSFGAINAPEIPFSEGLLEKVATTHLLIFTPARYDDGIFITLNSLRSRFGVDPDLSEPCMYNQDWYLREAFAADVSLDGQWHLIQKNVREDTRAKRPEEIESSLNRERFPGAVMCAFTFFAWWLHTGGEILWEYDFLWCADRDHNGDRIYVGRYSDPAGVNKSGFNVHRHLALRPAYSVAPEIVID
jgi:hypothetical protein